MPTLSLLRHAKSSWADPRLPDWGAAAGATGSPGREADREAPSPAWVRAGARTLLLGRARTRNARAGAARAQCLNGYARRGPLRSIRGRIACAPSARGKRDHVGDANRTQPGAPRACPRACGGRRRARAARDEVPDGGARNARACDELESTGPGRGNARSICRSKAASLRSARLPRIVSLHSCQRPDVNRQDVRAAPPCAGLACMRGLPVDACVRPPRACPRRPGRTRSGR
jgi:hypothetical protein